METFLKGYIASAVGLLAVYPIDTIKTRVQNNATSISFKGLYQGVAPQLFWVGGVKSLRFLFFEQAMISMTERNNATVMGAGLFSGAAVSIFTNPLEVHKIRRQMNMKFAISDMYRGWTLCMMRESVMAGFMFYTQDQLRPVIDNKAMLSVVASLPGCILSVPFDVFKTRCQTDMTYQQPSSIIRKAIRTEGWRVLWKGGLLRVLKALPQTSITMYVYDLLSTQK